MTMKTTFASLSMTLWLAATPAMAAPCVTSIDETALNTRYLQTELMVAALSCNEQARYNTFVTTFRSQIGAESASLRKLFKRVYGGNGTRQLNAYVTRLANDAAMRSAAEGKQRYCAVAGGLFTQALATPPEAFARLTQSNLIRGRHGFPRCN